jgi:hypothetical protein
MYETSPEDYLPSELKEVIDAITSGMFGSKGNYNKKSLKRLYFI